MNPVDARGEVTVVATAVVDPRDPFLTGHFPGFRIYPGVFFLEALARVARSTLGDRDAEIIHVRSMRFAAPLVGDDEFEVQAVVASGTVPNRHEVAGLCRLRDGTVCARITLTLEADADRQ